MKSRFIKFTLSASKFDHGQFDTFEVTKDIYES